MAEMLFVGRSVTIGPGGGSDTSLDCAKAIGEIATRTPKT
jgi:hypothetical protein